MRNRGLVAFVVPALIGLAIAGAGSAAAAGDWTPISRERALEQTRNAQLDERRLARATAALNELVVRKQGKKQLFYTELMETAQAIVTREGVDGLLSYRVQARAKTQQKRAYQGRPARQQTEVFFEIEVLRVEASIAEKKREMGWQVYATNALTMGLVQVVWAYRGPYRIENDWSRLKGRSLGLTPLYWQDEQRINAIAQVGGGASSHGPVS